MLLADLLRSKRIIRVVERGGVLRARCPFHERGRGDQTLWVAPNGSWGCHSSRCPQRSGGSLAYMLHLLGEDWEVARRVVASVAIVNYWQVFVVGGHGGEAAEEGLAREG